MPSKKSLRPEQAPLNFGVSGLAAGVDEAGRGPLAGPVVAAAVILDDLNPISGLNDSKKLTAKRRERLFDDIRARALCLLVDGNRLPALDIRAEAIVQGDALVAAISAASILAKVHRDRLCHLMHERYPVYGFDQHKGYGTAQHLAALQAHGPTDCHRKTFAPVARSLR